MISNAQTFNSRVVANLATVATSMKSFLEIVQPLPVKYGYSRGIRTEEAYVTYRQTGSTFSKAIGNSIVSERVTYVITVQTKTAEQNMLYSQCIKWGTEGSDVEFISDDVRPDVTVKDRWINTIILRMYTVVKVQRQAFTAEEVRQELQAIADRYIFCTSIYDATLAQSFIDRLVIPALEDREYSYQEVMSLKRLYLDKLILETTQY